MWVGFWSVEKSVQFSVVPDGRDSHDHAVGEFVEASAKVTASGASPLIGAAVNAATGASPLESSTYSTTRKTCAATIVGDLASVPWIAAMFPVGRRRSPTSRSSTATWVEVPGP
ncbi:hypothetical protein DSECCO2_655750 [anaerobic digester metagenome]